MTESEHFYVELLGLAVEWRPDPDNLYLTSGQDNLALHAVDASAARDANQRLDHIGFMLDSAEQVDAWFAWLYTRGVPVRSEPRNHRDGARSFYCQDPDGILIQFIHHPALTGPTGLREGGR
jgi:catechol 2,3-dioxygenase-like lactoylglutathione lyase family enzyme